MRDGRATRKRIAPTCFAFDVIDGCCSIHERLGSDARRIPHEVNARQTTAPVERRLADGGDAPGESHARQTFALRERSHADGGDAVGDGVSSCFSFGVSDE